MHRTPGVAGEADAWIGRARIGQLLNPIGGQPASTIGRYWRWLEEEVLDQIRTSEPEAYQWLLKYAKDLIGQCVAAGEGVLETRDEG